MQNRSGFPSGGSEMTVGFVGAGRMAEAIISSLLGSEMVAARQVCASDIAVGRRRLLKRRYGIRMFPKSLPVVTSAKVIFLAVKPQDLKKVVQEIAPGITRGHLVISIAAGKTISFIESFLTEAKVIRVMPNLSSLVMEGMSVFCSGTKTTAKAKKTATKLLSCFGKVLELPEERFDAVTALSGSSPAFLAYLLDMIIDAAVREGLKKKEALLLGKQTMLGTARLLIEKGIAPKELVRAVASAKGTTAAGLAVLEKSDVATVLRRTIRTAAKRSKELST